MRSKRSEQRKAARRSPPGRAARLAVRRKQTTLRCDSSRISGAARDESQRGFNLIELLMAMSIASVIFMSITVLFTYQAETLQTQNSVLSMQREIRFALDHMRRDLSSLGSNTTPNSRIDGLVCPKPAVDLKVMSLELGKGYVYNPSTNPYVQSIAMTLFGSLDVRTRYRVESISGAKVTLQAVDLPATESAWKDVFTTDRYLRLSNSQGNSFFYPISSTSFGDRSVTLASAPPRISGAQRCGYLATGYGMWVDVQGFIRYRVIADTRPGAPTDASSTALRGLLVRERLATDGKTLVSQISLAEDTVELAIADAAFDTDPSAATVVFQTYPLQDNPIVLSAGGGGLLGTSTSSVPESLRWLTVKIAVRAAVPDRHLAHDPRPGPHLPMLTYKLDAKRPTTCRVITMGTRIYMPTMVARNL